MKDRLGACITSSSATLRSTSVVRMDVLSESLQHCQELRVPAHTSYEVTAIFQSSSSIVVRKQRPWRHEVCALYLLQGGSLLWWCTSHCIGYALQQEELCYSCLSYAVRWLLHTTSRQVQRLIPDFCFLQKGRKWSESNSNVIRNFDTQSSFPAVSEAAACPLCLSTQHDHSSRQVAAEGQLCNFCLLNCFGLR